MKNAMQLKALIKNLALEQNVSAQLVLQNYMIERFLERVSISKYRNNYVIKGGFLISSIVGINSRTTMDLDATIKHYPVNEKSIESMIKEIISLDINDGITFIYNNIKEIRESDNYFGYRVSLSANFTTLSIPIKLDITTGDIITPNEIVYNYKLLMDNRTINVLSYNLSTIIAEKLETIISRADQNTRLRDFYDVYILYKLQYKNINIYELKEALENTSNKRNAINISNEYLRIMNLIENSKDMQSLWINYSKNNEYTRTINFNTISDSIIELLNLIYKAN